jgi:hypothetical protein
MKIRHALWVALIALTAVVTSTVTLAQPSLPTQRGGTGAAPPPSAPAATPVPAGTASDAQSGRQATSPSEMSGAKEIDGIDVIIKRKPPKGAALTRQTDQQGRFTFGNLPAGDYVISSPPSSATNWLGIFRVPFQRAGEDCAKRVAPNLH